MGYFIRNVTLSSYTCTCTYMLKASKENVNYVRKILTPITADCFAPTVE